MATLCSLGWPYTDAWNEGYAQSRAMMDAHDERTGQAIMTPASYGEYMVDNWDTLSKQTGTKNVVLN